MQMLHRFHVLALSGALMILPLQSSAEECEGNKEVVGTVVGAVLGGIVGSRFGKGGGKKAATVLGAVAGGYVGNRYGESLDCEDQKKHVQATHNALENQPSGQPSSWNNPDSGHSGSITPVKTWQRQDGRYCRDYKQSIVIDGKVEEAIGTACREDDGLWHVASNETSPPPPPAYSSPSGAQRF